MEKEWRRKEEEKKLPFRAAKCLGHSSRLEWQKLKKRKAPTLPGRKNQRLSRWVVGCPTRARTWTFLNQNQACCQLHHRTISLAVTGAVVPFGCANVLRHLFQANFRRKIFQEILALSTLKMPFTTPEYLIFRSRTS